MARLAKAETATEEKVVKTSAKTTKENKANTEEVTVEAPVTETEEAVEETKEETIAPAVEIEVEAPVKEEPEISIDTTVSTATQAEKACRVRMRDNHKCWVAGECYDLKKGQCYNVPENVKCILNKAGLLLPL